MNFKYLLFPITSMILLSGCGSDAYMKGETDPIEVIDTIAPVITINGSETIILNKGEQYTEQGATAQDNVDGPTTVIISGTVNTSIPGTYIITYTSTDQAGNIIK